MCVFFLNCCSEESFFGRPMTVRGTTLAQVFRKTQKASTSIDEEFGILRVFVRDFLGRFPEGVSSFCFISQNLQDIQPMLWDLPIYLVPPPSNSHNFEGLKGFFRSQEPSKEDLIIIKWCCPLQTAIEQICGHHHVLTGFWIWLLPFEIRSLEGFFAGVSKVSQRILLRLSFFGQAKGFFSLNHVITWHLWDRLLASHRSSTYWPPNLVQCHPVFRL